MTIEELEQVIHDYITDIYNVQYTGKLKIEKLNPIGYQIQLGMNVPQYPSVIYAELEDSKFLKFLYDELKSRNLTKVFYGKLDRVMPPECGIINKACSCHDKQ